MKEPLTTTAMLARVNELSLDLVGAALPTGTLDRSSPPVRAIVKELTQLLGDLDPAILDDLASSPLADVWEYIVHGPDALVEVDVVLNEKSVKQ